MKPLAASVGFSKCAKHALHFAFELAKRTNVTVHMFHAIYPAEGIGNGVYHVPLLSDYLSFRADELNRLKERFAKKRAFANVNIVTEVMVGYPDTMTVAYADEVDTDLIVMGTSMIWGVILYIFLTY